MAVSNLEMEERNQAVADPGGIPEMALVVVSAPAKLTSIHSVSCTTAQPQDHHQNRAWHELVGTTLRVRTGCIIGDFCLPSLKVRRCSVGGPERKTHLHRISEHLQRREEVMYLAPVRTPLEATSHGSHEL